MHISEIKPNPNNPRTIEDDRLKKLVRSIKEFPQMLELRPMVVDDDNVLLGGNMRLRAIELAGITEIPDAWVKRVSGFSEEEKNEFIIKDNRFAVVTCGDIRDKRGFYYRFQDDIKNIFATNGMKLYNELILVESIGTLPQRARRFMEHRKIGKCHQNVLVFFKGDPKQIKSIFPTVELQIEQTDEIANS